MGFCRRFSSSIHVASPLVFMQGRMKGIGRRLEQQLNESVRFLLQKPRIRNRAECMFGRFVLYVKITNPKNL